MLKIEKIDTSVKSHVRRFMEIPFQLYKDNPNWVPPIRIDVATQLNRQKHPFYEHSEADFFIASRDGRDVGRVAALCNRPFNEHHDKRQAQFYLFECEDDQEAAGGLLSTVYEWAGSRGMDTLVGPKGFSILDGYGVLVEGFEHRQMMVMMNYNHPYYSRLLENEGFEKEVDFLSCYLSAQEFRLPERVHKIADRVQERGTLRVKRFSSKRELMAWGERIGRAYNQAFINNWEYSPLTPREIQFVVDNLLQVADYRLVKIITHKEDVVGFLFAFPDISAALQRSKGRLFPFGLIDLFLEMRRTKWVALNGAGILPEFHGRGGNALLYSEMENTIRESRFEHADLTQVAETAVQMRQDMLNLGGKPYKNHRVYCRSI